LAVANIFPPGIALLGQAIHAEHLFIDGKMYKTTSQDVINGAVLKIRHITTDTKRRTKVFQ
jgi:hypothetical protein